MARSAAAPVTRRSFSQLSQPVDVPNLIDIQRRSFAALTDPKQGLLRETINDISPIEDYTGNLAIVFGDFKFDEPTHTIAECREKDITYSRPLNVTVAFQNARDLIGIERALNVFVEPSLQSFIADRGWLLDGSSWMYINAQTSVTRSATAVSSSSPESSLSSGRS